jgi:hypothetical protein
VLYPVGPIGGTGTTEVGAVPESNDTEQEVTSKLEVETVDGPTDEEQVDQAEESVEDSDNGSMYWLTSRLGKVHPVFLIAAIIATIWIEWVMIPMQSYENHPTAWIGLVIYLIVTLLSIVLLKYLFSVKFKTLLGVMTANNLVLTIPLGTIISLATGYTLLQLLSPQWEFTHDFVYIMIVSQLVATTILLLGIWWRTPKEVAYEEVDLQEVESKAIAEQPSRTHSYGLHTHRDLRAGKGRVNGLTNGLSNGIRIDKVLHEGLTNGLGMVNGIVGKSNIADGLGKNRPFSVAKKTKRLVVPVSAFIIIAMLLFLPMALVPTYDPSFIRDWSGVPSYNDGYERVNPNVDIKEYAAESDDTYLWTRVQVEGQMMGAKSPGTHTLFAFVDSDRNTGTGYSIGGIGAERMIKTNGYGGVIRYSNVYAFSETRNSDDWHGWSKAGKAFSVVNGDTLTTRAHLSLLKVEEGADIYFGLVDAEGEQDYSDTPVVLANEGALIVRQSSLAPDILERGLVDVILLELTARGRSIDLESLDIVTNQGILVPLSLPISLDVDQTIFVTVQLDTTDIEDAAFVDVHVEPQSIVTSQGTIVFNGKGAKAYLGSAPKRIIVDGAFADWTGENRRVFSEERGEATNPNVDLIEYQSYDDQANAFFYLNVDGTMMGGIRIPAYSEERPASRQPPSQKYNDNERVNIGAGSQTDFPLPELTGDDIAHIFIDTDQNKATGYRPTHPFEFPIGADFMIEIRGNDGTIENSDYFKFKGEQDKWSWKLEGSVSSFCDDSRMESGISLAALNIEESLFDVYFHVMDWNGDEDYSDGIMSDGAESHYSSEGTRKNGGFPDGDIDTIDGGSCAGLFGCHTLDATQVPITMSFNPTGPYNPGQTDIVISITVNLDNAATSTETGLSVRVGPSGTNARYGIENDGWVIQSDPHSGTNNFILESNLQGAGDTTLTWTVTAPSTGGTYYVEATVWYDNDGAGREYNIASEETITVIPEFQDILIPMFIVFSVVAAVRLAHVKKTKYERDS